jgi:hypothetical protein
VRNSKHFLVISLILHLLIFIILSRIILAPEDRFREFLDSLHIDFVEVKPVLREEIIPKPRLEKKEEKPEETERIEEPEPPKPAGIPIALEDHIAVVSRADSDEKPKTLRNSFKKPDKKGMAQTQPLDMKPIPSAIDDKEVVTIPSLHNGGGDISHGSGDLEFSGGEVGPLGGKRGNRGTSEKYISVMTGTPSIVKVSKFADILPSLARGIIERVKTGKVDIVFVIDTTGSMRDNIEGVRNYINSFLKPIEEKELDLALGLVEFTDRDVRKAKVMGLTQSQKKFKKWLDKTRFYGGEDLPESGYEAIVAALEKIDFRANSQRSFIFMSDSPQHDLDYDGKSRYTLDRIIALLNDERITVDVVGANYLPVKQLAWGTGGKWKHIPGGDPIVDIPVTNSSMIRSSLDRSLPPVTVEDKVTIEFDNSSPDWVDLSYKMLDPLGFKCLGTLTYRIEVGQKKSVEFTANIDLTKFRDQPGTYTLIYRIRDNTGNQDILRRTLELRAMDG